MDAFGWLIPIAVLGIPLFLATYVAFAGIVGQFIAQKAYFMLNRSYHKLWFGIVMAISWCCFEYIRGFYPFTFPWLFLGHTLITSNITTPLIPILGEFGGSIATFIPALVCYTLPPRYSVILYLLLSTAVLLAPVLVSYDADMRTGITIRAVQPNLQHHHFGSTERQHQAFKNIGSLSLQEPQDSNIDIIIWPEGAYPFLFKGTPEELELLSHFAPKGGILIMGADRVDANGAPYNSIITVNDRAELVAIYDKRHLVPFGEYIPGRKILPFMQKIAYGISDFHPGSQDPTLLASTPFWPMICYEVAFPNNHKITQQGFGFILNITNDSWFGNSIGPHQHLMIARFRAAQQRMPLIRVANTGISAYISATGKVLSSIPLNKRAIADFSVRYR
jgi:apolipoprotein N-acyltransferase